MFVFYKKNTLMLLDDYLQKSKGVLEVSLYFDLIRKLLIAALSTAVWSIVMYKFLAQGAVFSE